jgi:hypothetical protein
VRERAGDTTGGGRVINQPHRALIESRIVSPGEREPAHSKRFPKPGCPSPSSCGDGQFRQQIWYRNQCDGVSDGGVSGTRRATIGCDSCRTRMSIQYLSAIAAATFCFMSGISSTFTLSNSLSATFNFT